MSAAVISLVQRDGADLFTTSEAIAAGAGVEHASTMRLIDNNVADLEEFGRVGFEIAPFATAGGVQKKRIAKLNEQQATLILTYLRNTGQVRAFKKALVKAFYEMAQIIRDSQPKSLEQRTQELLGELSTVVESQRRELEVAAPKVAAWDSIIGSAGSWSYNDAAKALHEHGVISIGEQRLVRKLVDWGYLYRDHKRRPHVYQQYLDQNLFAVKARTYTDHITGELRESSAPQVRITGKGLDMLRRRLTEADAA